ncbi:CpsD/CapB family tyrosine-protein kinase [Bacillus paramycoides]|uniref:CpsD/CapB family tyrosine-protein kinase n=1 Tax=Bacillus paramycoides TaxID=2026194 RepID=A0A1J9UX82_9BACI|nr:MULTISPECIES: CpsD/CapB family tyrosine-protein kinase [Bacillus cereus group]MED0964784.1 CpsD/CapB family tyrosine-protein kinase [Bacillus paramycoides]MED0970153.1 CpsD/CapB family tyrosine-protein kinase [Bacillus paramycoides]MED0985598.1 CpsD/CapB family tyrosine-protein kinase [Bacillus paramycoides]MED1104594.1 CpsD/CapB family tyrosine-protein kinase [Bacillus paramycoides]MED1114543.1 CpsD/CapB family tyrosine-protein kinase [Bacillus paramycoides]
MSMFKRKKQLKFDPHDAVMKEQFYTVYHELKKSGKQVFTVSSTKDRGAVALLIVNMGLVFAEMKKKVLLVDVNFSDPKLHLLLQSNHMTTVNDIISSSTLNYESFSSDLSEYLYCIPAKKTVHIGTPLVAMDEFDNVIDKWKEEFDYIFFYSSEVFELPVTHFIAEKCDGVILAVKKRKDSLSAVQKVIADIKRKECELLGIVLYS